MDDPKIEKPIEGEGEVKEPKIKKEEPSTFKFGDSEYSKEEAEKFIGLGKRADEISKEHGGFDKYVESWGNKSNKIGELTKKIEEIEKKELTKKTEEGEELTPEERKKIALEQAKELGLITQADFDEKLNERVVQVLEGRKLIRTCQRLEKTRDGSDGKPPFKTREIIDYMKETGIRNPSIAYDIKFKPEIDRWREKEIGKAKKKGLPTESGSAGEKEPKLAKVTKDNLGDMIKEVLSGK